MARGSFRSGLFPLDGSRRLARQVVGHAADPLEGEDRTLPGITHCRLLLRRDDMLNQFSAGRYLRL